MPETSVQRVAALRPAIDQLRALSASLADLLYVLEKYAAAYDFLLAHHAKFHVGDRVQLAVTPLIDETHSPGWLGSKHFLVAGALGEVWDADVRNGAFYYQVVFGAESWQDFSGNVYPVASDRRASYCFREDELANAVHCPPPPEA